MIENIDRSYLEIKSIKSLIEALPPKEHFIKIVKSDDFQINKFFYKNVGRKHKWTDRLLWSEMDWNRYLSNPAVETYTLKVKDDPAGFFELIFHLDLKEIEIAYLGLLEEYHNKKLGGHLLTTAIKKSFENKDIKRVWVHTCSLDHKNALNNYLARGMTIYKKETIKI